MKKCKKNSLGVYNLLYIGVLVGVLLGCDTTSNSSQENGGDASSIEETNIEESTPNTTSPDVELEGWNLIWSDEFNGGGTADSNKWDYRIWDPGKVNDELQAYTKRIENSRQENGHLTITALNDSTGGSRYTSARLVTDGKFEFLYGKVEARAILPGGRGSWPAIWMLGANIGEVGWPDCGEIDIMEYVGYNPNVIHGTAHAKNYYWKIDEQQTKQIPVTGVENEYHVYGIEWYEDRIDFLFDGDVYFTALPKGGDINNLDAWPFWKSVV